MRLAIVISAVALCVLSVMRLGRPATTTATAADSAAAARSDEGSPAAAPAVEIESTATSLAGDAQPTPSSTVHKAATAGAEIASCYWTRPGVEPDKVAAAWMLTRLVTPGAALRIIPKDEEEPELGTPFDVPGHPLHRTPGNATSDAVLRAFDIEDGFAQAVTAVVRELELMPWSDNPDPFFSTVRGGLAEAVNVSTDDMAAMLEGMRFLDELHADWASKDVAASVP
jgi:hypothetical protein